MAQAHMAFIVRLIKGLSCLLASMWSPAPHLSCGSPGFHTLCDQLLAPITCTTVCMLQSLNMTAEAFFLLHIAVWPALAQYR